MRKISLLGLAVLVAAPATQLSAQEAEQVVNIEVAAINEIALSGSPSLVINTATAGEAPDNDTDGATWAITTNEANKRVTAQIESAMPSGIVLMVTFDAPVGSGLSAGQVALGTSALPVVSGISKLNESGLGLEYELSASSEAGVLAATSRTVTYTIVTAP